MTPADIRQARRAARRALPAAERRRKALAIAQRLAGLPAFQQAQTIGLYAATPEEVDTAPIQALCEATAKSLWLPVVNASSWRPTPLLYRRFVPGVTPLRKNRYGILEPPGRRGAGIPGQALDLALAPLVAFNEQCDRIGMGQGYYDRAFAERRLPRATTLLVGIAFECQKASFAPQPHDRPMDWVVTEAAVYARLGRPGSRSG